MANGLENCDSEPGFLRKQLAVAVKSIQWSYAIFWSPSTRQHGYGFFFCNQFLMPLFFILGLYIYIGFDFSCVIFVLLGWICLCRSIHQMGVEYPNWYCDFDCLNLWCLVLATIYGNEVGY